VVRKFLYLIAFLVVLYLGGRLALTFYPEQLSRVAFVPSGKFEAQAPLATSVYDDPAMWISRPGLGPSDPARWVPPGAPPAPGTVKAAVFFIHPTSYLAKSHWNAPLDDAGSRTRAGLFVRGLASPFALTQDLWAPRYRQAAFGAFLTEDPQGQQALDLAYADVLQAFDFFLASVGKDQPIVLAGHSQGALHLMHLLKDRVAGKPLAARIAAAYVVGWPVSLSHDLPVMGLPACTAAAQTGCVMSWLSFADPADPAMIASAYARRPALDGQSPAGSAFLCSNPITGLQGGAAPANANLGTLVPTISLQDGTVKSGLVGAGCRPDGFLSIGAGTDMGPYVLPGNNYHVYDIPLFWANLRADFARRVAAWKP
jgi:hypothetical protein